MKDKYFCIIMILFLLTVGCAGCISSERPHSTTINSISEFTPMPEQFSSFDELLRTIDDYRTDGRFKSSGLKHIRHINIIDSRNCELPLSKIFVSIGNVGVYYDYVEQDILLINQYNNNQDERSVEALSYVRVITTLNVDPLPPNQVPDFIMNNQSIFEKIEKDGQIYYIAALTSSIDELIGWEIFMVIDGFVVTVGIPVTMGLNAGLNLCQNAIMKYDIIK
jgi:hypothetical protein